MTKGLLLLTSLSLLAACGAEPPANAGRTAPAPRVIVEPVTVEPQQMRLEAVGTAQALRSITLYPAVAGEVVEVSFSAGQFVEAGRVLLKLDQRDEVLAVELAESRLREATSLFERYQRSAASGATLPTTLESAKTELEIARITLSRARIALEDRNIIAPFAGHVGITDINIGDRIQPATAVTSLDDRRELRVKFDLPELVVGQIKMGDEVTLNNWDQQRPAAMARIIEVGTRVDPLARTFEARAHVDNSADLLRPGMSFRVQLDIRGNDYPLMPEIALQWGADGAYVWAVTDGIASQIPVNIVQRVKGQVLVDATLAPGTLIVVEGLQRLRPGINVTPDTAVAQDNTRAPATTDGKPG